jgi:hypothetical protein
MSSARLACWNCHAERFTETLIGSPAARCQCFASVQAANVNRIARVLGNMANDKALRDLLLNYIDWDNAHLKFDDAVKDFPAALRGKRPQGSPHSAWELLEHLRIAQSDILEFTRDPKHASPKFPDGYWPATEAPPTDTAWDESTAAYRADLRALAALTADESVDLYARIPHGDGQTVFRQILLTADHNAYHLGQLMLVKRILGG